MGPCCGKLFRSSSTESLPYFDPAIQPPPLPPLPLPSPHEFHGVVHSARHSPVRPNFTAHQTFSPRPPLHSPVSARYVPSPAAHPTSPPHTALSARVMMTPSSARMGLSGISRGYYPNLSSANDVDDVYGSSTNFSARQLRFQSSTSSARAAPSQSATHRGIPEMVFTPPASRSNTPALAFADPYPARMRSLTPAVYGGVGTISSRSASPVNLVPADSFLAVPDSRPLYPSRNNSPAIVSRSATPALRSATPALRSATPALRSGTPPLQQAQQPLPFTALPTLPAPASPYRVKHPSPGLTTTVMAAPAPPAFAYRSTTPLPHDRIALAIQKFEEALTDPSTTADPSTARTLGTSRLESARQAGAFAHHSVNASAPAQRPPLPTTSPHHPQRVQLQLRAASPTPPLALNNPLARPSAVPPLPLGEVKSFATSAGTTSTPSYPPDHGPVDLSPNLDDFPMRKDHHPTQNDHISRPGYLQLRLPSLVSTTGSGSRRQSRAIPEDNANMSPSAMGMYRGMAARHGSVVSAIDPASLDLGSIDTPPPTNTAKQRNASRGLALPPRMIGE